MVMQKELFRLVAAVQDPHLPFGLGELGMLERVTVTEDDAIEIVVNIPCHHCPGLQMLQDDIQVALKSVGVEKKVSISFEGSQSWVPMDMSEEARAALRKAGVQVRTEPLGAV